VLSFLTEDRGFSGPEHTAEGVSYQRLGLRIDMGFWTWKNERGFTTMLIQAGADGTERRAELSVMYAACGLGPARDVPESAGTLYVIRKRIGQHATALQSLLPLLDESSADALFIDCRGPLQ
jgi:hypothetical protein